MHFVNFEFNTFFFFFAIIIFTVGIEPSLVGCSTTPVNELGSVRPIQVDIRAVQRGNPQITLDAEMSGGQS